jgi:hypothetical protein
MGVERGGGWSERGGEANITEAETDCTRRSEEEEEGAGYRAAVKNYFSGGWQTVH